MANPFETTVFNPLQALMLGQQSYASGVEGNKRAAKEAALAEAGQMAAGGDRAGALARLLGVGEYQGAGLMNTMDQNAWTRQHTTERDVVGDKRWNAEHALRVQNANEGKFVIKENPDGSFSRIKVTGPEGPITGTGAAVSGNPFSDGGSFNEGQGKAAGFTDRMLQSESVLRSPSGRPGDTAWLHDQGANFAQTRLSNADKTPIVGGLIGGVSNYMISEDRQKYDQAKRDFINAQLRRESGAVISPEEFASADKQYFPIPGDTQDVINQKAKNRRAAVEAMGREGGKSYRPKSIYTADGRVVPLPKVGEMKDGYRFKGGDPADPNSWVKAQ